MSKILKNNTASIVSIGDVGQDVPASGQLTIEPTDYLLYAASSDAVTLIGDSTLTVNDGSSDLSISDGVDLIKGIFPNPVGVRDADGTELEVYNIEGRDGIRVEAIEEDSKDFFLAIDRRLGQGGDPDNFSMDINGSSSSVDFYYEVAVGEGPQWWDYLSIFVADGGSTDTGDFGSIGGGLSNGLQLIIRLNGTEYEIGNFKDNVGLSLCFSQHAFSLTSGENGNGWMDSSDFFMGTKEFKRRMRLEEGDRIILRVRDNLTGLNEMGAVARLSRKVTP